MAETSPSSLPPVTQEAFLADRMAFWSSFTSFTKGSVIAMIILLLAMLIFLV